MKARNNPFSTGRTTNLPYIFSDGNCIEDLCRKFGELNYRGAIVGPKGCGKSTLMREMRDVLSQENIIHYVYVNDSEPLARNEQKRIEAALCPGSIVLLDGADMLGYRQWKCFKREVCKCAKGMLIISHKSGLLPTLIECSGDLTVFKRFAAELLPYHQFDESFLNSVYDKCKGNIRACFRILYDVCARMQD
jgi:hypothetical protein